MNKETITWLCGEFLNSLDNSIYFTTHWSEYPHETAWLEHRNRNEATETNHFSPLTDMRFDDTPGCTQSFALSHPGTLFPLLFSNWILFLSNCCSKNLIPLQKIPEYHLLNYLINSLVLTICGEPLEINSHPARKCSKFTSLCAIKWIFRAFSYPIIQESLRKDSVSLCSIGTLGVRKLLSFVTERFSSMSQILTWQIYQGLLPMLLCVSYHDDNLTSPHSISISFFDIFREFGIRSILQSLRDWKHLTLALLNSLSSTLSFEFYEIDSLIRHPKDFQYLSLIVGLVGSSKFADPATNERFEVQCNRAFEICRQQFHIANTVFSNPYVDLSQQWSAIWFLESVSSLLCSILCIDSSEVPPRVIYEESYQGNVYFLLDGVLECSVEFSSYLSFLLLTTIRSSTTQHRSPANSNTMRIDSLVKYQDIVKLFTEILLLAFVNPNISLSQYRSILRIHFDFIHQMMILLPSSELKSSESAVGLDLLILCTLSPILHNFRCLSKILSKISNRSLIQKFQAMNDDLPSLLDVFQKLTSFQSTPSSLFQIGLKSSFQHPEDSIVTSLYHQFPTFGKYCDAIISDRWVALSSIMDFVMEIQKPGSSHQFQLFFDPFHQKLFASGMEDLNHCSDDSISEIINTFRVSIRYLCHSSLVSDPSLIQLLEEVLHSIWNCCFETDNISYLNMKLFIQFSFSVEVLSLLGDEHVSILQNYFSMIIKYSAHTKPFILQFLIFHLTSLSYQSQHYELMLPFFPFFGKLLIYREPTHDEHCLSDEYLNLDEKDGRYLETIYGILDYSRVHNIERFTSAQSVRIMLLLYLEHLQLHCQHQEQNDEEHGQNCEKGGKKREKYREMTTSIQELILFLLNMNLQKCYQIFASVGSERFGEKLRCWQSLCVLIHSIDAQLCQQISSQVIGHLTDSVAHGIRVHIEIFCAKLLVKYPNIMLPPLLELLKRFHHSQQVLASFFIHFTHFS